MRRIFFTGTLASVPKVLSDLQEPTRRALVDVLVTATLADGVLATEELAELRTLMTLLPAFQNLSGPTIQGYFEAATSNYNEAVSLVRLDSFLVRIADDLGTDEVRLAAFKLVCQVVCSDGEVHPLETEILGHVMSAFRLDMGTANEVFKEVRALSPVP